MWRRAWNLSRAKCHWFYVRFESVAHQHHRKRIDAQIKDGEERSEKKKNEVWHSTAFTSDGFDRRVAACRNPIQTSAGSIYTKSLNDRFCKGIVNMFPEVYRSAKPTARGGVVAMLRSSSPRLQLLME